MKMRDIINLVEAARKAVPAQSPNLNSTGTSPNPILAEKPVIPLLVLTHPGSACGSANELLGRYDAQANRDGLVIELNAWKGNILVVDGGLSEELPQFMSFDTAIKGALHRAKGAGLASGRIFACDDETPNWPAKVARTVKKLNLDPATPITCTGAWHCPGEDYGCVNSTEQALRKSGFTNVHISEYAVIDPGVGDDDDDDDEDDDLYDSVSTDDLTPIDEAREPPSFEVDPGQALYHHGEAGTSFAQLKHRPEDHDPARPLAIIVHPGDMLEANVGWGHDPRAYAKVKKFSMQNQQGTAEELRVLRQKGYDTVVVHRQSCYDIQLGDDCDDDFVFAIGDATREGSVVFGDDLPAGVAWMIENLHIEQRPHIFLAGAYNTPENGCLTFIGQELEKIVGEDRISVSSYSPPGNSPGALWRPGNRTIPYSKRKGDAWRKMPKGEGE